MEPVFMLLAQSAAKAACLAIDGGVKVQEVDVKEIQRMYAEDPLLDGSAPDIVVDDVEVEVASDSGWRRVNASNGYGRSYFLLDQTRKDERLRFPFEVASDGKYTVYTYFIRRNGSSKVTEIVVNNGEKDELVWLDAGRITVKGQTSGEWVALGEYDMQKGKPAYVEFTNGGKVTGQICADAVLVVKNK